MILVTGFFFHLYTGDIEKILKYCQEHGVILSAKACPHCNSECRLDYRCKYFRCDKAVIAGHKKRRRCNFKESVFKNTWFEKSHLDVETNLFFLKIFLFDSFTYKFVTSELGLSKPTINDWCSLAREVCVNWVFSRCQKIGGEGQVVEIRLIQI